MTAKPDFKILLVAAAALFVWTLAGQGAVARNLTIDDVLALKVADDPQISPDGAWVAYTVRSNDMEDDKRTTQIFMVSRDGEAVVQLTGSDYSASRPRWSPDGQLLAFLAAKGNGEVKEEDRKSQVWTLDRRGGEAQQYTDVPQGVSAFEWSPVDEKMLLVIKDPSEAELEKMKAEEEGKTHEDKPRPWVIDRLQFKQDYVGYLDRTRTHIYVQAGRKAAPLQLTFGDYDDADPVWSPDGKSIAFVSNRTEEPDGNTNSDIFVVSTEGDKKTRKARKVTANPGPDTAPAWSHDGTMLTYVSAIDLSKIWYATQHLAVIPAKGGEAQLLTTALDRNVIRPVYARDDSAIYFIVEDSGAQHIARIDLASGQISRPVAGDVVVQRFNVGADGAIAALMSSVHQPEDVFLLEDGGLRQLTDTNRDLLADIDLAAVREVQFSNPDGTEIEGFIFTPPNYRKGKRYPAILRIHGGPVSQYDFSFNADSQLYAANGYVVVMTNPRGSSGYGEEFSAALFADWGGIDFGDVMAGVDYAIDQGLADADRLGVGGWSYGGILTNHVITKTDRFKGAVTGASEVVYIANYGHDIYQYVWEKELGLPWVDRETWERITPFYDVDKITTPTLIMGGKEDWNVPVMNSEQLYQALKRLGVTTELVVYPGEFHGFRRPSFIKDRYERWLGWYDKYVKGK